MKTLNPASVPAVPPEAGAAADVPTVPSRRRLWTYRVAATIVVLAIVASPGSSGLLAPFTGAHDELHRWHAVDGAAQLILLAGGAVLLTLRQPARRQLLIQAVLATVIPLSLLTGALPPTTMRNVVPSVVIAGLLLAAHPARRGLFALRPTIGDNRVALAAALLSAPVLLWNAVDNVALQLGSAGNEHVAMSHWSTSASLAVSLLLLGLLAASGRDGWRALCGLLAGAYAYLGLSAALLPHHDGSWGRTGAGLALCAAVAYATAARRPTSA